MMRQIAILGCGWLGLPLAKSMVSKGFLVKGSTTTSGKIPILEEAGIQAFQIAVSENGISGDVDSFLQDSEILIIDIPPKLRETPSGLGMAFVKKINNIIPFIKKAKVQKIIFVSSTSVYNEDNAIVTENSPTHPDTESGRQLVEAEKLLRVDFATTIIRFGGLVGDDRHPVHHLAGKQNLANPEAPINLIHQKDCIGIIERIIELDCRNTTFNAVAPFHPTRKEYYTQKAIDLGLPVPQFNNAGKSSCKTIHSNLLESELHYEFQIPKP